mgnify:CR=1 FL=1
MKWVQVAIASTSMLALDSKEKHERFHRYISDVVLSPH